MLAKSCFFIGHRGAPSEIFPELSTAVEQHICEFGVIHFIVGHYGGFDKLAAKAVIAAKALHPEITLSLLLPYHPAEQPIQIPKGFDDTFYPSGMEKAPRRIAIVKANQYVANRVDHLIAYAWHPASNARDLVEYLQGRERRELIKITRIEPPLSVMPPLPPS